MAKSKVKRDLLNIGIVGMGNIGNVHARCYGNNPHTKVIAVCDLIKQRADRAAEAYGAQAFYSVKDMLESGLSLDACSVTTAGKENGGDHFDPTMQLLGTGLPVLGEKPISNEIPKARKMVNEAHKKKVPYAINLNHRFTPSAKRAKEWLDTGKMGDLHMINMTMWINNPNESSPHFHMRALHPHSIDVMRYFAGEVGRVHAFFKKGTGRRIWSNVQVNLLFKSGTIGHLTGSYDAGGSFGLETCELVGSEARAVIEEACEALTWYPRKSNEVQRFEHLGGMQSFGDTFQSRINAWIEDLRSEASPAEIDGRAEDALKAQLVIEAAIQSWNTKSVVTVPALR